MSNFRIIKNSEIEKTFRTEKIKKDFDLNIKNTTEIFEGDIKLPEQWNIGVIVGNSGTGKTTIAKHLYKEYVDKKIIYTAKSVIDDMPKEKSVDEIVKMFYTVGFGSVPSWLKPYNVLSNGEKMRVDLARSILEDNFIVFDEFTSVVDREVAKTTCIALNKAIKKTKKKIILISCHYDILDYLEANWVFDTDKMNQVFMKAHLEKNKENLKLKNVQNLSGQSLGNIII